MSKKNNIDTIADSVMEQISADKVTMRSRLFYISWTIVLIIGVVLTTLFAAVFLTAVFSDFRFASESEVFVFEEGKSLVFSFIPWLLVLFFAITIAAAYLLTKKTEYAHSKSSLSVLGVVTSVILLTSAFLLFTGFDSTINRTPVGRLQDISNALESKSLNVELVKKDDGRIFVELDGKKLELFSKNERAIERIESFFQEGDTIELFGELDEKSGKIELLGVRPPKDLRGRPFNLR